MTANASQFIGSIPENYDEGLGPHIFEPHAQDLSQRVAAAQPARVLELAAGTGIASRFIRNAMPAGSMLTVTDLNQPMLEVAKTKFAADELVQFEAVDACDLPYTDASFDLITCQFGVMFFPDKARHFSEAKRVLTPGGKYIFNCWGPWAENRFGEIAYEATRMHYPDNPPAFYKVPFSFHDAAEIERTLAAAGFAEVQTEVVRLTNTIRSESDFARGIIFGNPVAAEIVERGGSCEAIRIELELTLREELNGQLDLMAIVATAKKSD